jgi:glycosyl transferase family 87
VNGSPATPAPYYVKALALGTCAYLIGIHFWTWVFTLPVFLNGRADFRQLYTAGYMVRSGHSYQLYDYDSQLRFQNELVSHADIALPFIRPAYQALIFAPFSRLPYRTAYFAFLALNLCLLWVSFRLLRPKLVSLAGIYQWLPSAIFLAFLPIGAALIQGQDSILLLTLLAASLTFLERNRSFAAGILVGCGMFKFQIVLPIALLFFLWRRWRFVAGFIAASLVVGSLSVWLVGVSQAKIYVLSLITMSSGATAAANQLRYPIQVQAMPNLHGLIFGLGDGHVSPTWVTALTLVLSGLVFLVTALSAWSVKEDSSRFLLAVTLSAVVSYYLFIHDLSILIIPVAITLDRFLKAETTDDALGRLRARTAALVFVSPVCISYVPNYFYIVCVPISIFLVALMKPPPGE